MEHEKTIAIRLPGELRARLEKERVRMSKAAGAEVKLSAAVRAILERALKK
jgi:predicted DNA-binding protein